MNHSITKTFINSVYVCGSRSIRSVVEEKATVILYSDVFKGPPVPLP